jgi:tRNA threonylcarbamoyladenosine modification (KEOPS) complex  Pcc1 subunit
MQLLLEEKIRQKTQTEKNSVLKEELEASRRDNTKSKLETSTGREREVTKAVRRQVLPTHNHPQKLYSEAVVGRAERKFQLTVKSKDSKTPDEIKSLIRTQVNPTEI